MANPTNPALKRGTKYGDLKRRLWFLLGAMVVYRIGTHIPVPGINASVLDELFRGQQGGILGLLNVFFYLDARRTVLRLCLAFVLLNGILTGITLYMQPDYYGYGFALTLLILVAAAVQLLDRKFSKLEYETYMLRN